VDEVAKQENDHHLVVQWVGEEVLEPAQTSDTQFEVKRAELAVPEVLIGRMSTVDDMGETVGVREGGLGGGSAFQDDPDIIVHKVLEREEVVLREGLAETHRGLEARESSTNYTALIDEDKEVAIRVGGPKGDEREPGLLHSLETSLDFDVRRVGLRVARPKVAGIVRGIVNVHHQLIELAHLGAARDVDLLVVVHCNACEGHGGGDGGVQEFLRDEELGRAEADRLVGEVVNERSKTEGDERGREEGLGQEQLAVDLEAEALLLEGVPGDTHHAVEEPRPV